MSAERKKESNRRVLRERKRECEREREREKERERERKKERRVECMTVEEECGEIERRVE